LNFAGNKRVRKMNWYLEVWRKRLDVNGRAGRREYWMFTLYNFIFALSAAIIDNIIGTNFTNLPYGFLYFIYLLTLVVPSLTVTVRRLHDSGKSGWMLLLLLIPFIGTIWIFVLTVLEGDPGKNIYGHDPQVI
jgi:uncharacterized membrane protein YhaH (DUF805 family)